MTRMQCREPVYGALCVTALPGVTEADSALFAMCFVMVPRSGRVELANRFLTMDGAPGGVASLIHMPKECAITAESASMARTFVVTCDCVVVSILETKFGLGHEGITPVNRMCGLGRGDHVRGLRRY
jgi:hypothetical protein